MRNSHKVRMSSNSLEYLDKLNFFAAFMRASADTNCGRNDGYDLASNNMIMVGSCGEGYFMMNLLWGYIAWNKGANNELA
jgi:hypothetical protein